MFAESNPFTGEMNLKLNEDEIQLILDAVSNYRQTFPIFRRHDVAFESANFIESCDDMVFEIKAEIDLARLRINRV